MAIQTVCCGSYNLFEKLVTMHVIMNMKRKLVENFTIRARQVCQKEQDAYRKLLERMSYRNLLQNHANGIKACHRR